MVYIIGFIVRKPFLVFRSTIVIVKRFEPFIKFRIKLIAIGVIVEIVMSFILKSNEAKAGIVFVFFIINFVAVFDWNNFIIKAMIASY